MAAKAYALSGFILGHNLRACWSPTQPTKHENQQQFLAPACITIQSMTGRATLSHTLRSANIKRISWFT